MKTEKIKILDLKPSQISVGMLEVEHRMKDFEHMSQDEFHEYTLKHPVPVVDSGHGLYIIDHHHLCKAYHELGHKNVHFTITKDLSKLSRDDFFKEMDSRNWILPQDQFGVARSYGNIPMNIRGMADDPFRSLVWKLKELGHWQKVNVPFAEFKVANYFRDKFVIENTMESFNSVVTLVIDYIKNNKETLANIPGFA